tara:strand:- start:6665 stop:7585 length:921 start_codon:yes stop_codon:yes gene_type:complete
VQSVFCIGHAVQDLVFSIDEIPTRAIKYNASSFETIGGGPAATAAVAISKLGGSASLASRVGDDILADFIISELKSYGVDCSLVKRIEGKQSSTSTVLIDNAGERMIINFQDSSLNPDIKWLKEKFVLDTTAVLADTRWPEAAVHVFKLAKQKGIPAVLDADIPVPKDGELVNAATHVAFSEYGLIEFTGIKNVESALQSVHERFGNCCCVTLGSKGLIIIDDGKQSHFPAFNINVRDTLGAGDVWHGAFSLALAEGKDTINAVMFASAAAALKVQNGGGRAGCPSRENVDSFLQLHYEAKKSYVT